MEDFVSFEIAKKLKEKGFSEECKELLWEYHIAENVTTFFTKTAKDMAIVSSLA